MSSIALNEDMREIKEVKEIKEIQSLEAMLQCSSLSEKSFPETLERINNSPLHSSIEDWKKDKDNANFT